MNLYSGFPEMAQAEQIREEGFWTDEVMEQAEQYKSYSERHGRNESMAF